MFARLMGLKTISPDGLQRLLQNGEPVSVIDVNSPQVWAKAHVPGARNLDPANYTDSELPPDRNGLVVFYCSNPMCRKAPNAARRARQFAYSNVQVMSAGISGWVAAKLPTEAAA
jgi:rhodanese-related sulfurtransferase